MHSFPIQSRITLRCLKIEGDYSVGPLFRCFQWHDEAASFRVMVRFTRVTIPFKTNVPSPPIPGIFLYPPYNSTAATLFGFLTKAAFQMEDEAIIVYKILAASCTMPFVVVNLSTWVIWPDP